MKRLFGILAIILFFCFSVGARAKYSDYVQVGGKSVKTSSITTYLLMETFPSSTITVYLTGTTTLATLYLNNSGTSKANPFTADSKGYYEFYADNGIYDIKFSGTGIITPFTKAGIILSDVNEEYNVRNFGAKCDGATNDRLAIANAITLAVAAGGGRITLPNISCNIASNGLVLGSNLIFEGKASQVSILYSGTGIAIDAASQSDTIIRNVVVKTSNAAATGIRFGDSSQYCGLENSKIISSSVSANTGIGLDLDATDINSSGTTAFSGLFHMTDSQILGYKFGTRIKGTNTNNLTWTSITGRNVSIIGNSAGILAGSKGLWTDDKSNMEGSELIGIVVESFAVGIQIDSCGSCFGFTRLSGGIEGNTVNYSFPASLNGEFLNPHGGGPFIRALSNGLNNRWMNEKIMNGIWTTESYYDHIHVIYDGGGDVLNWGQQRGGSLIEGEFTTDKFIVSSGSSGNSLVRDNWFKFLEYKQSFNSVCPTEGSWGVGSIVWNSAPALGSPVGCITLTSGTSRTALSGITGSVGSGLANFVVNSVSTIIKNDYINIVGLSGVRRVTFISGTTLTIDPVADAPVSGAAVSYATPTFMTIDSSNLLKQKEGAVLSISGNAITPVYPIHHVGAGLIKTINVPTNFTSGTIYIIPDSAFTYDATGNIIGTGTAVIGRTMTFTYSSSTSKWYASY